MIQALIAAIIEFVAILFALAAGTSFHEAKDKDTGGNGVFLLVLSLLLAVCALGVAAR